MLPDLSPLCGAAPRDLTDATAAGVAHHHRLDALFHASRLFRGLMSEAVSALEQRAVPRGGARGAAHVAVELLLDGVLADDEGARQAFQGSLPGGLTFDDPDASARWRRLCERLAATAVPLAYQDPDFVARAVVGALSRRPRLALDDASALALRLELPALASRVRAAAPALVDAH
jgi:hypothetical protein